MAPRRPADDTDQVVPPVSPVGDGGDEENEPPTLKTPGLLGEYATLPILEHPLLPVIHDWVIVTIQLVRTASASGLFRWPT